VPRQDSRYFLIGISATGGRLHNVREQNHRKSEDHNPESEGDHRQSIRAAGEPENDPAKPVEYSEEPKHPQHYRRESERDSRPIEELIPNQPRHRLCVEACGENGIEAQRVGVPTKVARSGRRH
jgi:hypothetical protein